MFVDIVIPNKNEESFIATAEKLGYDALVFLYARPKDVPVLNRFSSSVKLFSGLIAAPKDVHSYRKQTDLLFVQNILDNRALFESKSIDAIFSVESTSRRDFMHQRASGFNHILANLAAKNSIALMFHMGLLFGSHADVHAGRMMQNIHLCRKYKVSMIIASLASDPYIMRSPQDMRNLFEVLGMTSTESAAALSYALTAITLNQKKRKKMIFEGVEVVD